MKTKSRVRLKVNNKRLIAKLKHAEKVIQYERSNKWYIVDTPSTYTENFVIEQYQEALRAKEVEIFQLRKELATWKYDFNAKNIPLRIT